MSKAIRLLTLALSVIIMGLTFTTAYALSLDKWPGAESTSVSVDTLGESDMLKELINDKKVKPVGYYEITTEDSRFNGSLVRVYVKREQPERNWSTFYRNFIIPGCKKFAEAVGVDIGDDFDESIFSISPFQPITYNAA